MYAGAAGWSQSNVFDQTESNLTYWEGSESFDYTTGVSSDNSEGTHLLQLSLEEALGVQLEAHQVTDDERDTHYQCIRMLEDIVAQLGPGWHIKPFGSFVNGFSTAGADLDVTCFHEDVNTQDNGRAIEELQVKLLPALRRQQRFRIIKEVWSARVPIVKIIFDSKTEVDLSCHNPQALQNTHLLKAYARLSPLIRELVILIKVWAKAEGVLGANVQHLSAYSWTLMTIYFLQVDPEFNLPCLPTWAFSGHEDDEKVGDDFPWTCNVSLVVLVERFFRFFASDFQWGTEVVSVRQGRRGFILDPDFQLLPRQSSPNRIHLEDPFLLGRNLNCVLGHPQEQMLRAKLQQTTMTLSSGAVPEVFLSVEGGMEVQLVLLQKMQDRKQQELLQMQAFSKVMFDFRDELLQVNSTLVGYQTALPSLSDKKIHAVAHWQWSSSSEAASNALNKPAYLKRSWVGSAWDPSSQQTQQDHSDSASLPIKPYKTRKQKPPQIIYPPQHYLWAGEKHSQKYQQSQATHTGRETRLQNGNQHFRLNTNKDATRTGCEYPPGTSNQQNLLHGSSNDDSQAVNASVMTAISRALRSADTLRMPPPPEYVPQTRLGNVQVFSL